MIVIANYLDSNGINVEMKFVSDSEESILEFSNSRDFWRIHYIDKDKDYYWDKTFGEFTTDQLNKLRDAFNKSIVSQ